MSKQKIYIGKTKEQFIDWIKNRYPYTPVPEPEPIVSHADTWYKYAGDTEWKIVSIIGDINSGDYAPTAQIPNVTNVVELEIGSDVTNIGNSAFVDCTSLTSVTISNSVMSIGQYAFSGCSGLMSVTISDHMTSIEQSTFYGCSGLTSMTIPESVTSIGDSAFGGCSGLTSVTIPDSVTNIGYSAFSGCSGLTSVTIPDSVTSIGNGAFSACGGLTSVTIPDSVTTIGDFAFYYCSSLTSVMFLGRTTAQVQELENYPWGISDTSIIHNIIGPDTRVKYAWSTSWDSFPLSGTLNSDDLPSRDGINYVGIGSSIDEIGYRAFSGMEFLRGVEIPNTVTTIGTRAFSGAERMPDIEIPSSVSSIGSDAFYGCHSLSSVMFDGKTIEQVQAMDNYPWGISDTSIIHGELG